MEDRSGNVYFLVYDETNNKEKSIGFIKGILQNSEGRLTISRL